MFSDYLTFAKREGVTFVIKQLLVSNPYPWKNAVGTTMLSIHLTQIFYYFLSFIAATRSDMRFFVETNNSVYDGTKGNEDDVDGDNHNDFYVGAEDDDNVLDDDIIVLDGDDCQ